ncbi:MAG: 3-deoxy-D-manno-octulosonic acid transferase [Bacteroidetes bacterium]|nr:3-deoxy-D-manno-octulosonic acid transferase [Bacteroidota bacterium]
MRLLFYNLITQAYFFGIRLAALRSEKARRWVKGRVGLFEKLEQAFSTKRSDNQRVVWMHCASLGEFEQGRPVIETLRNEKPEVIVLLTFFSPSGYEVRKEYPLADWVFYLPSDTKFNAQRFLQTVQPDLAIFVKYEFWYHFLSQLKEKKVPSVLISAVFRPSHPFFKWYGGLHREMLRSFSKILVQDKASLQLISTFNFTNTEVYQTGDTRVDRVLDIVLNHKSLPLVEDFCGDSNILICGSTWPADEAMLYSIFSNKIFQDWKFILAPHDVQLAHLQDIESKIAEPFIRYSQLISNKPNNAKVLLIDNIGLLSTIYSYGKLAFIGGGFGSGIHNTLEPAAFGLPVIFGPNFEKFEEAVWFVNYGGGFVVKDGRQLEEILIKLSDDNMRKKSSGTVKTYIEQQAGASQKVLKQLNMLLT